jgi:hypothetical protein
MSEPREYKAFHTGVLIFVIVLVMYPLSMGPVGLIAKKTGMDMEMLRAAYYPIIWLHDHTVLKKPLEDYVALWGCK